MSVAAARTQSLNPVTPVSLPARPEKRTTTKTATVKPRWIWLVKNWKYDVDRSAHWFKRFYFYCVFLPFNRLSYAVFNLAPPCAKDSQGRLCWIEEQGSWETEWQAEQEALKYSFGHAVKVSLGEALPAETVRTQQISPNSPESVKAMYRRNGKGDTIQVPRLDAVRLAAKIAQTDSIVDQYHKAT